jgi:hypothetical protein
MSGRKKVGKVVGEIEIGGGHLTGKSGRDRSIFAAYAPLV